MRIKVHKQDIVKSSQLTSSVITPKDTLPILSNILLDTSLKEGFLSLIATDLDVGISTQVPAEILEDGAITVSGKKFFDILKELPEEGVEISVKKNNVVSITCGQSYFKIIGIPKDEFPKLPTIDTKKSIILPQHSLKKILEKTVFAASRDETRYILNGIYINTQDGYMKFVATDGRRLVVVKEEVKNANDVNLNKGVVVPTKAAHQLYKALAVEGDAQILFGDNQIMFNLGSTTIVSRLIKGEYPNYEQAIPKEVKEKLKINKEQFLFAVKRASLLTTQDSQAIKLDVFKNKLVVSKSTANIGETKEEVLAQYNGVELAIGFNPDYLIDALKNIEDEQVSIELAGPEKPGVIRVNNDNYIYVVLPMQGA